MVVNTYFGFNVLWTNLLRPLKGGETGFIKVHPIPKLSPEENCHTRTQLAISSDLISISDDQLGPLGGIIIMRGPAGRPTGRPTGRCYSFQSPNELESDLSLAQLGWDGVGRGWTGLDGVGRGWTGLDGLGQGSTGLDGVGWSCMGLDGV